MKRILPCLILFVVIIGLSCFIAGDDTSEAASPLSASCNGCHTDFTSVLPKGHALVKGHDLTACTSCHAPDWAGTAQKNAFSSRIHRAHVAPKGALDCTVCHDWVSGKKFGLLGHEGSWGKPGKDDMDLMKQIFSSWGGSNYMDSLHGQKGIVCAQCHGKNLPKAEDTVEDVKCLDCHGPLEQLAQKTGAKEDFKNRNPHKSHLGDLACTVCHKGHAESKVYCLDCHRNFKMKIPGEAKR